MAKFEFVEWIGEFLKAKTFHFDWDPGNESKNYEKHGISTQSIEDAFFDENLIVVGKQIQPFVVEERYAVLGKSHDQRIVFVVFAIRNSKLRPISARYANVKERKIYES